LIIKADIPQFLALLHRNAALIEAAYHDGSVVSTEETASAIRSLHTARVLSVREEGRYGLTRLMREMLDENTQRQQRFAIGGNIGEEINRLDKLLVELEEAAGRGSLDDIEAYTDDLCQSLYDIKDLITQDLLQFDQIMSTKFSDVRTIEEKMRQNAHYLERAKRLQEAVEQINRAELHERFSSPLIGEPGRVYRIAISRSISGWSASLLSISKVFEQFMFSFRQIAEETHRMRAFTRFLKEGGQNRLGEALHKAHLCPAMNRVIPSDRDEWPDIFSEQGSRAVAAITRGMKLTETKQSIERQPGKRSQDNTPVSIEEDQSPEDKDLSVFLAGISQGGGWVSAAEWVETHGSVPRAIFLEHVLAWSDASADEHEVRYIEATPTPPRRANIEIEDIEVCLAA
jgi:hypothetical protein